MRLMRGRCQDREVRNTTPSNSRRPGDGRSRVSGRRSRGTDTQRVAGEPPATVRGNEPVPPSPGSGSVPRKSDTGFGGHSFDDISRRDPSRPRSTAGDSRAHQAPRSPDQYVREQRPQARAVRGHRGPRSGGSAAHNESTSTRRWARRWNNSNASARGAAGGSFSIRLRKFLPGVIATHVAVIGVMVAVALIILLSLDVSFIAAPATIGSLWLSCNTAPLSMSGAELGLLPLCPVLAYAAWIAVRIRSVVRERISVSDVRMLVTCSLVVPVLVTLTALAIIWNAQSMLPVQVPSVWASVLSTMAINALAIIFGLGTRLWRALLRFYGLPQWPVDAARLGLAFLGAMWGIGAVVVVVSLIAHWSAFTDAYAIASGVGGKIGLTLLWMAYFPNVALASGAVLAGGEANFGAAQVSLFTATRAEMPPLPVLAVMPGDVLAGAWLGLLVPAAVAILVYRRFLNQRSVVVSPYATVGVAAATAGSVGLVSAWLTSGVVGAYGWSGPTAWLVGGVSAAWMLGVGLITMAVTGIRRGGGLAQQMIVHSGAGEKADIASEDGSVARERRSSVATGYTAVSEPEPGDGNETECLANPNEGDDAGDDADSSETNHGVVADKDTDTKEHCSDDNLQDEPDDTETDDGESTDSEADTTALDDESDARNTIEADSTEDDRAGTATGGGATEDSTSDETAGGEGAPTK